jgi:hypothetical protein
MQIAAPLGGLVDAGEGEGGVLRWGQVWGYEGGLTM